MLCFFFFFFFFNDTATTEIYTLSLHDALPILLGLILVMGIGPLMPWRKTTPRHLARSLATPTGLGFAAAFAAALAGAREPWAGVAVFVCGFTAGTVLLEFIRGAAARHDALGEAYPLALLGLVRRNNRRYGGYVVHLGVVTLSLAVVASHFYQQERQVNLQPGQAIEVGSYHLAFQQLQERTEPGVRVVDAP